MIEPAMPTAHLTSLAEYLAGNYEPDAEYVEGVVVPRAMPIFPHSRMQKLLLRALDDAGSPLGFHAWPELRMVTQGEPRSRFRVPDVCVTRGVPSEDVLTGPPHLCIEILSPEDKALELHRKIDEYLAFGVPYVWVIDPETYFGEIHSPAGVEAVRTGVFRAGDLSIDLNRL